MFVESSYRLVRDWEIILPVLLLAQGDPQAKDLLRRALEARYGVSPQAIDNLELDLKGRARAKVGPITTWVPVDIVAYFRFPNASRWDFAVKPAGVTVQRGIEAFDGSTYRYQRGGGAAKISDNLDVVNSLQRRLWAIAALVLSPLGEHFVKLTYIDDHSFEAQNTQFQDSVRLYVRDDQTLERVEVKCLNPDLHKEQMFSLRLSEDQEPVNDIMMPCKISAFWDDTPYFEVKPTRVENSTTIADSIFSLMG